MVQSWPWFFRRLPVIAIAQETGIHGQRILPALTDVSFQKEIPDIFSGTVEVDEIYYWGTMEKQKTPHQSQW